MALRLLLGAALLSAAYARPADSNTLSQDLSNVSLPYTDDSATEPIDLTTAALKVQGSRRRRDSPKRGLISDLLSGLESLVSSLTQQQTNGNSVLGTLQAPLLPDFLEVSSLLNGLLPWGHRTAAGTNTYTNPPFTGVTRYYQFDVTYQTIAPDGVEKNGLVINGAFPGPTIEANWGDWIEVTVNNNLDNEGFSLHAHGLLQTETPFMDGVPAVSQCPIPPGGSFVYRFRADLYGTTWYHSHYSAQYAGGALGALIIYGPSHYGHYDEDLGPVFLTDWYHDAYYDLVEQVMAPAAEGLLPPFSNNNLINGKNNYPCASTSLPCTENAGLSKFQIHSGKKYRLRLINGGVEGVQKFSIDGYTLTVIANDFVPVKPYQTDVVTLGIGQRTDVVIEASGDPTDMVWMRSTLGTSAFAGGCTLTDGVSPEALAAIYYEHADTTGVPTTTSSITTDQINSCGNDPLTSTVPYYSLQPDLSPGTTHSVDITYGSNGTHNLFYMNNSTYRANYNDPVLLGAKLGQTTFDSEANVYDCQAGASTRVILYNYAQVGAHPMHMHGHNFFVLAEGYGTWDGTITNQASPQRRDTQILLNAQDPNTPAYVVLQFTNDNPGAWPLHCHIAWHISAGLYMTLLEEADLVVSSIDIPSSSAQLCTDWSAWTSDHTADEIDSGL